MRRPAEYIARIERGESAQASGEDIDAATSRGETMMLGLRLLEEGVPQSRFRERYGGSVGDFFAQELGEGVAKGLIEVTPERVRLTPQGRFVSNQVLKLFV